jgi:hypothetical protein
MKNNSIRYAIVAVALLLPQSAAAIGEWPHETPLMTCFKSGERVSGMNKICYYNCAGSTAAITVQSFELCPLSIQN